MQRFIGRAISCILAAAFVFAAAPPAVAATTSTVNGAVRDADGRPLAGAEVTLSGVVRLSKVTDNAGDFTFSDVPTGLYTIQISKPGFETYRNDNVAAFIGETVTVNATLAAASFSSLKTIASVSTTTPGVAPINTSTAAVNTISSQVFTDQGSQQVTKVLNETPGIFTYTSGNAASPDAPQIPQIRGALPYETESLIDGHPVSVGFSGFFSPTLINPALLQDVEVVKGPGSMPTEINYAIGGTVNYRTLDPTSTPQQSFQVGTDRWGALTTAIKATGSTLHHKLDYAAGFASDGDPGPLQNYRVGGSQLPLVYGLAPYSINGQQLATFPEGENLTSIPPSFLQYAGEPGSVQLNEPLYACCTPLDSGYHSTSELAKLRINFSAESALTLSYLGGQSVAGTADLNANVTTPVGTTGQSLSIFSPCFDPLLQATASPCDYTGSVPAGSAIPFDTIAWDNGSEWIQQNLFQGEFRTTIGQATLLARYYTGALNDNETIGQTAPTVWYAKAWGGVPLCPVGATAGEESCTLANGTTVAPTETYFNGQSTEFETGDSFNQTYTEDKMNGESVELSRMYGNDTFTLSYDRSYQASSEYIDEAFADLNEFEVPPGSNQTFDTIALRGNIFLKPRLTLALADYAIDYSSHYTPDGGVTWDNSTHGYNAPRAALTWQPNADTSWRFSLGSSIAPPYMSLLSSPGSAPQSLVQPATYYTQNLNNGNIEPETAFGYDLGVDRRIARSTAVSADVYLTNLHNMFLSSTFENGTYEGLPVYATQTQNLGQARYEGVEVSIAHTPQFGFGWRAQGSLQRAYTYNLPPYFYCAIPGPGCAYTQNLGVVPNVNFSGSGIGWNGVGTSPTAIGSGGSVPYSQGYAELNWVGHYGQYYNVGWTYYGNNNGFDEPAFGVLSATIRIQMRQGTYLQVSGDNLTGVYAEPYYSDFGGVVVPLASRPGQTVGTLGATSGYYYGPTNVRFLLMQDLQL